MTESTSEAPRPHLRVVRGEPTAEELAVLTAVVTARGGDAPADPSPADQRGRWNDPAAARRRLLLTGDGAWRSTYLT